MSKETTDQSGFFQIYQKCQFFENIFSALSIFIYLCGFRKSFSTQQCLLVMLKKWKRSVDNSKTFGASLTGLSKAFDCFDHQVLIAKLNN